MITLCVDMSRKEGNFDAPMAGPSIEMTIYSAAAGPSHTSPSYSQEISGQSQPLSYEHRLAIYPVNWLWKKYIHIYAA